MVHRSQLTTPHIFLAASDWSRRLYLHSTYNKAAPPHLAYAYRTYTAFVVVALGRLLPLVDPLVDPSVDLSVDPSQDVARRMQGEHTKEQEQWEKESQRHEKAGLDMASKVATQEWREEKSYEATEKYVCLGCLGGEREKEREARAQEGMLAHLNVFDLFEHFRVCDPTSQQL